MKTYTDVTPAGLIGRCWNRYKRPVRYHRFGPVHAVSLILLSAACSTSHSQVGSERVGTEPGKGSGYIAGACGVRLFYRVEGSAPDTVVVLHGGPGLNLEGLRPDLRPLTSHHTLLYLDQRGSGRSEMPDTLRLTVELMVKDVEAVRRTLSLERLTLLGHSWGAGLAVLYAARYPGRVGRMVLVGPIPPRLHPHMDQYIAGQEARRDSAESARSAVLDSLWATAPDPYPPCRESTRILLRGIAATPEAADRIKGDLCAGTPENIRSQGLVLRRVWASILPGFPESDFADLSYDWRPLAERIAAPTLVVHGAGDPMPVAGSEEWARAFPRGRLVVISDAGHYPQAEQPKQFFPAVEGFLAQAPQPAYPRRPGAP